MKIIMNDGNVRECVDKAEELHVIRHTAAHVMAQAIKRLYPEAMFAYGPSTEKGFYYDVDLGERKLSDEDLAAIEAEMRKIVKENLPIKPFILSRSEAVAFMEERGEKYKVEHIGDLADVGVRTGLKDESSNRCLSISFNSDLFFLGVDGFLGFGGSGNISF